MRARKAAAQLLSLPPRTLEIAAPPSRRRPPASDATTPSERMRRLMPPVDATHAAFTPAIAFYRRRFLAPRIAILFPAHEVSSTLTSTSQAPTPARVLSIIEPPPPPPPLSAEADDCFAMSMAARATAMAAEPAIGAPAAFHDAFSAHTGRSFFRPRYSHSHAAWSFSRGTPQCRRCSRLEAAPEGRVMARQPRCDNIRRPVISILAYFRPRQPCFSCDFTTRLQA